MAGILILALPASAQDSSFSRAVALQKAGDFEGAAGEYREFLAAHPDNVEARSNLGVVLVNLGKYEDAINEYKAALTSAPSNAVVRLNLGLALYKASQLEEALEAFGLVLKASPEKLQARYLAADCQLRLGRPAEAINLLESLGASGAG